ncbi:MAG: redoxin domain-containing protein [Rubrobacteraceae bacterium]
MRRLVVISLLILVLAVGWRSYGSPETATGNLTLPQPAPSLGEGAPEFTAQTLDGGEFEVKDKGIYVLTFWSTLNQDSSESQPGFSELTREYSDRGVSFGAVYVGNTPGDYEEMPYEVMMDSDGRLTSLYNVKRVPRLFLIQDGQVKFVYNTYNEENQKILEEELKELVETL